MEIPAPVAYEDALGMRADGESVRDGMGSPAVRRGGVARAWEAGEPICIGVLGGIGELW